MMFSVFGEYSANCYVIGYKDGSVINTEDWLVPNLTLIKSDVRDVILNDSLILN